MSRGQGLFSLSGRYVPVAMLPNPFKFVFLYQFYFAEVIFYTFESVLVGNVTGGLRVHLRGS